jgi:NCAIR mutase (PurE)-related protein
MDERLHQLLTAVRRGDLSPEAAALRLAQETDLGFAVVDDGRPHRTGLPEVVFGEGKTPEQVASILSHLNSRGYKALATRLDERKAEKVLELLPGASYEPVPRMLWSAPGDPNPFAATLPGHVVVASAGTSDLPVAEEAARCAEWSGLAVQRVTDVGVAGLHRLLTRLPDIRSADVIIAVAGMEGALPSVVAGLVRAPVIAVPTSVGYGASFGGVTALLAMLNSCASGVSVVNIDNGFGAAQAAWRILANRGPT